ncbi:MAG TPA: ABC transporter permease [Steroidobacteraceae bacterium]|jgi:putative ABC transport system permease protein|nr:ABC transporter permease [Steroidobacteraceae bacterium]
MNLLRQMTAVTGMNLSNLPQRFGASLVVVIGIAGVVAVLVSVLAMGVGLARTIAGTGRPDRAIILSTGAFTEVVSSIPRESVANIIGAPGIRHDAAGNPIAAAEVLAQVQVPQRSGGKAINVTLRGVGKSEPLLRPEIHLVAGRVFRPGLHELIVGRNAETRYGGLRIGSHLSFQNGDWTVVGVFGSAGANSLDSQVLTDAETLLSAFQRDAFQSITVRLDDPTSLDRLKRALASDPTLHVTVNRESDYFAAQSRGLNTVLKVIGYFIGGMMAVGALFGALNTLYAAVSARSLEIATLRAIGFGAAAVVASVLVEALLLAITGALLGALCAWSFFDGHVSSIMMNGLQAPMSFALAVTPALVILGIVWACVIGVIGGLFPAIRAARLPVATALRAS